MVDNGKVFAGHEQIAPKRERKFSSQNHTGPAAEDLTSMRKHLPKKQNFKKCFA
jgi:hypothetical protein